MIWKEVTKKDGGTEMPIFKKKNQKRSSIGFVLPDNSGDICISGYTPLNKNPEIVTACRKIAELIGMLTVHIMENTDSGDKRIVNELSAKLDINPNPVMTRKTFIEAIVMNLLLYGAALYGVQLKAGSVVYPQWYIRTEVLIREQPYL